MQSLQTMIDVTYLYICLPRGNPPVDSMELTITLKDCDNIWFEGKL